MKILFAHIQNFQSIENIEINLDLPGVNLIVGENHLNRANESIKKYIKSIDKKEEFKKIAHSNWESEINLFNNK